MVLAQVGGRRFRNRRTKNGAAIIDKTANTIRIDMEIVCQDEKITSETVTVTLPGGGKEVDEEDVDCWTIRVVSFVGEDAFSEDIP